MTALKISSYVLALALAALGIWLSDRQSTLEPDAGTTPTAVDTAADAERGPLETR